MKFTLIGNDYGDFSRFDCNVWFTSDTHLNAERTFELSRRNNMFKSCKDMTTYIIQSMDQIPDEDLLIHLGDVGDMNAAKLMLMAHPNTILVLGNYEKDEMIKYNLSFKTYKKFLMDTVGFRSVYDSHLILDNGTDTKFVLVHDPKFYVDNSHSLDPLLHHHQKLYCLFGHIHGRQMVKRFGLDVGVDAHHFKPVSFDDVMFYIEAIEKYYDDSVFC